MTFAPFAMDRLPPPVRDASAWYGPALAASADWLEMLGDAEVAEIEAAALALARAAPIWRN